MRKRSTKPEDKETIQNRILNELIAIENRIEKIESSLGDLKKEQRERRKRREKGWLVFGVVLGGLLGIAGNLWVSYFVKVLEPKLSWFDWILTLMLNTILLALFIAYLTYWAYSRVTE